MHTHAAPSVKPHLAVVALYRVPVCQTVLVCQMDVCDAFRLCMLLTSYMCLIASVRVSMCAVLTSHVSLFSHYVCSQFLFPTFFLKLSSSVWEELFGNDICHCVGVLESQQVFCVSFHGPFIYPSIFPPSGPMHFNEFEVCEMHL